MLTFSLFTSSSITAQGAEADKLLVGTRSSIGTAGSPMLTVAWNADHTLAVANDCPKEGDTASQEVRMVNVGTWKLVRPNVVQLLLPNGQLPVTIDASFEVLDERGPHLIDEQGILATFLRQEASKRLPMTCAGAVADVELEPGWLKDQNGCDHFNPSPTVGESIEWTGRCVAGLADGEGVELWFQSGKETGRYTGTLAKGFKHGHGSFRYADGSTYAGEYRDGRFDGVGILSRPTGLRYEGHFAAGQYSGRGALTSPDGSLFEGEFAAGHAEGLGTLKDRGVPPTQALAVWDGKQVTYITLGKSLPGPDCTKMSEARRPEMGSWTGVAGFMARVTVVDGRVTDWDIYTLDGTDQPALDQALRESIIDALKGYECSGNQTFGQIFEFKG